MSVPNPEAPLDTSDDGVDCSTSQTSSEGSDIDAFLPVINAIDLDALASVALRIRQRRESQLSSVTELPSQEVSCSVQTPPWYGSFNLVYPLNFSDGVRWVARIPGNALSGFGPLDCQRFITDVRTRTFIRSATSIPVPEVFAWDIDTETLGVPYTLESHVEGTQLAERWIDKSWTTEEKRLKALRNIATLMSELHRFQFGKIGSLSFTPDGQISQICEMVCVDRDVEMMMSGEDFWGKAYTIGPFDTTKSWLVYNQDRSMGEGASWRKAEFELLRLAINSAPESVDACGRFALGHPDFNYQNIFVDDEGNITGIIDWDGIQTQPRALGFARYPSWITRDWDPVKYRDGIDVEGWREEDSPEQLLRYRTEYAKAFAELQLPASEYSVDDTRLSHLLEAIDIAVDDSICRPWIIKKLLEHAFDGKVPFTFPEYCKAFEAGEAGPWLDEVKKAFGTMWHPEWD